MGWNHHDCDEYLAIDVFKGYCGRDKKIKMADEVACNKFKPVKKCKFCKRYTPKKDFIGMCKGKTLVYTDLVAETCKDFSWAKDLNG